METLTLSEIIRRNTNITHVHVPRHVFYSTLHCADVKNEQCFPYLNSSNPEPTCNHSRLPTDFASEIENLTQTVQQLRNESYVLENKLALNENEKQNLTTQLTYLQQKYNGRCNTTNTTDENSNSEDDIRTLKQENQMLRNKVDALKSTQGSESKSGKSLVDDKALVCLIILLCVLLLSTAIFCVLYLRAKKECKKLLCIFSQFDYSEPKQIESTGV